MFKWGTKDRQFSEEFVKIVKDIQKIATDINKTHPRFLHPVNLGIGSKGWELPVLVIWLQDLQKKLNKKIRVMDFGPAYSPLPQLLQDYGFEVVGLDNDQSKCFRRKPIYKAFPNINYFIGTIHDYAPTERFDAIVSASVIEHIRPDVLDKALTCMRHLLQPDGKMAHVADFIFPDKTMSGTYKIDFFKLGKDFNFNIPNEKMCPGSPTFDWDYVKKTENLIDENMGNATRLLIGDDI